ncbi:hypothetical protein V8E36_008732 [Tilletia maclaganii]
MPSTLLSSLTTAHHLTLIPDSAGNGLPPQSLLFSSFDSFALSLGGSAFSSSDSEPPPLRSLSFTFAAPAVAFDHAELSVADGLISVSSAESGSTRVDGHLLDAGESATLRDDILIELGGSQPFQAALTLSVRLDRAALPPTSDLGFDIPCLPVTPALMRHLLALADHEQQRTHFHRLLPAAAASSFHYGAFTDCGAPVTLEDDVVSEAASLTRTGPYSRPPTPASSPSVLLRPSAGRAPAVCAVPGRALDHGAPPASDGCVPLSPLLLPHCSEIFAPAPSAPASYTPAAVTSSAAPTSATPSASAASAWRRAEHASAERAPSTAPTLGLPPTEHACGPEPPGARPGAAPTRPSRVRVCWADDAPGLASPASSPSSAPTPAASSSLETLMCRIHSAWAAARDLARSRVGDFDHVLSRVGDALAEARRAAALDRALAHLQHVRTMRSGTSAISSSASSAPIPMQAMPPSSTGHATPMLDDTRSVAHPPQDAAPLPPSARSPPLSNASSASPSPPSSSSPCPPAPHGSSFRASAAPFIPPSPMAAPAPLLGSPGAWLLSMLHTTLDHLFAGTFFNLHPCIFDPLLPVAPTSQPPFALRTSPAT